MSLQISNDELKEMENLSFCEYLKIMRNYANENNVPIIQDEGLSFLLTLIRLKKPKKILEIGTAIGYSSSLMALEYLDCEVYTIERNEKMYNEALKNIKALGLEQRVHIIFKDALESFDDVKDIKFDMIIIYAAKAQYNKFFNLYSPLLNDDGFILTDNMLFHGVTMETAASRAVRGLIRKLNNYKDFLLNNDDYDTTIFNLGDGMAVSIKKTTKKDNSNCYFK